MKGLARQELLFAIDHFHDYVRPNLLRMMSWYIGFERGFDFSLGKNNKFIERYLPEEDWRLLLSTYQQNDYEKMWQSLFTCFSLFRKYSKAVAAQLGCDYPDYDDAITNYTNDIYREITM